MGQEAGHLEKARHNERFLRTFDIDTTPYLDWVAVVAFYAAVHFLEALLAKSPIHPTDHGERLRRVQQRSRTAYQHFRLLKDFAEGARYDPGMKLSTQDVRGKIIPAFEAFKAAAGVST